METTQVNTRSNEVPLGPMVPVFERDVMEIQQLLPSRRTIVRHDAPRQALQEQPFPLGFRDRVGTITKQKCADRKGGYLVVIKGRRQHV